MASKRGKTAKPSSRRSTSSKPEVNLNATQPEPKSRMPRPCAARKNMEEQIRGRGGFYAINLSAMHRAAAQPLGKDPWIWAKRAEPVIGASHQDKWGHDPDRLRLQPIRDLIACDDDDLDEFDYPGDCETLHAEVALIYALYLDGKLPEVSPLGSA